MDQVTLHCIHTHVSRSAGQRKDSNCGPRGQAVGLSIPQDLCSEEHDWVPRGGQGPSHQEGNIADSLLWFVAFCLLY